MELAFGERRIVRSLQDTDVSDIAVFTITDLPRWDDIRPNVMIVPVDVEPTASQVSAIINRLTCINDIEELLIDRADKALAANDAFLALASPTNAEVLAQVRLLTRAVSALIRLVLRKLTGAP